jgi:hypothetical protein
MTTGDTGKFDLRPEEGTGIIDDPSVIESSASPMELTPDQAKLLKTGYSHPDIIKCGNVLGLNLVLTPQIVAETEPVVIPGYLVETAQEVASLALRQESHYVDGLVARGKIAEANQRRSSPWGTEPKMELLNLFFTRQLEEAANTKDAASS